MSKVMEILSQIFLGIFLIVFVSVLLFGYSQMSEEDKELIMWVNMWSNQ